MITLQSDRLSFTFPEIGADLARLVEEHIQIVLPRMIAEDRSHAVAELKSRWGHQRALAGWREAAERKLLEATPAQIETAIRSQATRLMRPGCGGTIAAMGLAFQRTLRIPDDGSIYPLPAGLGRFPLRQVDDFSETIPEPWLKRGGVLMPMYQSEALWLNFDGHYPFAVKTAAGKINAVTGEAWNNGLQAAPQNYLVLPEQPWLDGFAVRKGIIRQFVAMPLGDGYSVEEQVTGQGEAGGLQVQVFPMKAEAYFRTELAGQLPAQLQDLLEALTGPLPSRSDHVLYCASPASPVCAEGAMGLGAGGTMRQEIYEDPHDFADWDCSATNRCFVHLCNSLVWRQITGSNPPHPPFSSREYARAGVPWFDYYRDDWAALEGSEILAGVKSVAALGKKKGAAPLPENASIDPHLVVQYGNARRPDEVREWAES